MDKRIRKRYWVDSQIQGALVIRVLIHWLIFSVVAGVLTVYLQYVTAPFVPLSQHLAELWRHQSVFVFVMLILLPLFIHDTVKLSNRFVGPMMRLRRVMSEVAEGKPAPPIKFREGDFWQDFAVVFNTMIQRGKFDQPSEHGQQTQEGLQEVG